MAVIKNLSENVGKPIGEAMREAGYSESTSKTPKRLTERLGWKELMDRHLPDDLLAQVHSELLHNEDWRAREAGLDKAYRLKARYVVPRFIPEPDPLEELSDEELEEMSKEAEEQLRRVRAGAPKAKSGK